MANPPHGTSNRYKNKGCRCEPCLDAGREWMRDYYVRTNGLKKMVRTGEPMKLGSQGGDSARGPHQNAVRKGGGRTQEQKKRKPTVIVYDDTDG